MTRRRRLLRESADWAEILEIRLNLSPLWTSDDFDIEEDDQDDQDEEHEEGDFEDDQDDDVDDHAYKVDDVAEDDIEERYEIDDDPYERDEYDDDDSFTVITSSFGQSGTADDDDNEHDDDSHDIADDVSEGSDVSTDGSDDSSTALPERGDDDSDFDDESFSTDSANDSISAFESADDARSTDDGINNVDESPEQSGEDASPIDAAIVDVANELIESGASQSETEATTDNLPTESDLGPDASNEIADESQANSSEAVESHQADGEGNSDEPAAVNESISAPSDAQTSTVESRSPHANEPNTVTGSSAANAAADRVNAEPSASDAAQSATEIAPGRASQPDGEGSEGSKNVGQNTTVTAEQPSNDEAQANVEPNAEPTRAVTIAGFPMSILFGRATRNDGEFGALSSSQRESLSPFAVLTPGSALPASRLSLLTATVLAAGLLTAAGRSNRQIVQRIARKLRIAMTATKVQYGETLRDAAGRRELKIEEQTWENS